MYTDDTDTERRAGDLRIPLPCHVRLTGWAICRRHPLMGLTVEGSMADDDAHERRVGALNSCAVDETLTPPCRWRNPRKAYSRSMAEQRSNWKIGSVPTWERLGVATDLFHQLYTYAPSATICTVWECSSAIPSTSVTSLRGRSPVSVHATPCGLIWSC